MKTAKEFLISKEIKLNPQNITGKRWDEFNSKIFEAMEDFAEHKAIEFRKWCEVKEVELDFMGEVNHTTEELYEIFCNQTAAGC